MRIIVCGGRDFCDWRSMDKVLSKIFPKEIMQGGAIGADFLAKAWGIYNDVPVSEMKANWKKHGKRAGPIRNLDMLLHYEPDLVVAFPGGNGTRHMIEVSKKHNYEVLNAHW